MTRSFIFLAALLLLSVATAAAADFTDVSENPAVLPFAFLDACTTGDLDAVQKLLQEHPQYANGRSKQGESCLHVAGIMGQTSVTLAVLAAGGDPDIRTTFEQGLRMHPLSWNVYGGHLENCKVLIEHGVDVNADIDSMTSPGEKVTSLDIINDTVSVHVDAKFHDIQALLIKNGAKTYKELTGGEGEDTKEDAEADKSEL